MLDCRECLLVQVDGRVDHCGSLRLTLYALELVIVKLLRLGHCVLAREEASLSCLISLLWDRGRAGVVASEEDALLLLGGFLHAVRQEVGETDSTDRVDVLQIVASARVGCDAQVCASAAQVNLTPPEYLFKWKLVVLSVLFKLHIRLIGLEDVACGHVLETLLEGCQTVALPIEPSCSVIHKAMACGIYHPRRHARNLGAAGHGLLERGHAKDGPPAHLTVFNIVVEVHLLLFSEDLLSDRLAFSAHHRLESHVCPIKNG